jgi:hypothetical protein
MKTILTILIPLDEAGMKQAAGVLPAHKQSERFGEAIDQAINNTAIPKLINQHKGRIVGVTYIPYAGLSFFVEIEPQE